MATFQVRLNGSNFVSEDRQRKFQDALNDNHTVASMNQGQVSEAAQGKTGPGAAPERNANATEAANVRPVHGEMPQDAGKPVLDQALDHSAALQSQMMELHQQYLAQQAEYIQLITAVLNQQGKVLDMGNGTMHAGIIETFQRTLDHFHTIREGDMKVHQEFLTQQAEFSDRFLKTLESGVTLHPRDIPSLPPVRATAAEKISPEPQTSPVVQADSGSVETAVEKTAAAPAEEVPAAAPEPKAGISSAVLTRSLLEIVGEKTGYPPDVLEPGMDLEADLGIDSIKRVEILGALEERFPNLPPADTQALAETRTLQEIVDYMGRETATLSQEAPAAVPEAPPAESDTASVDVPPAAETLQDSSTTGEFSTDLEAVLLEIVGEKTGYPVEVLELEMDMEADLGIDSIKRVEILAAMEERVPGLPAVEADVLGELRTLGQITDMLGAVPSAGNQPSPAEGQEKKKAGRKGDLEIKTARLAKLPEPDRLEIKIPSDRPLIISHNGTPAVSEVVSALQAEGWNVVVWSYPGTRDADTKKGIPSDTAAVLQEEPGKEAISAALEKIRSAYGIPAGFIHLHPLPDNQDLFSEREDMLLKQVFLLAGCIKPDLEVSEEGTRNLFIAVTSTGGKLGLNGQKTFQEGGSLTGLVKSLYREWPGVFCRVLDIDQEMEPEQLGRTLIEEIHDPDRGLLEVGFDGGTRVTIIQEKSAGL